MRRIMDEYFTIGQIFRRGLLKNAEGKPYSNKGTISKIVNSMKYKWFETPYGKAKCLTKKQITIHNNKWKNALLVK